MLCLYMIPSWATRRYCLNRFFSTNNHTNQFNIKLTESTTVKITVSSLSPYESPRYTHPKGKKKEYDWEIDSKRINLQIKASRYDFIALGIGSRDYNLINTVYHYSDKHLSSTSRNRMIRSTFGHYFPIFREIHSLNLSSGDVGRDKISEMCSFGDAAFKSPKEILYFFHHIAVTRYKDRTVINWVNAIKNSMPNFYNAIVGGNANYIAYNFYTKLKNRDLPNINDTNGSYSILLVVEKSVYELVNSILMNNLQLWLHTNRSFDEEMKALTPTNPNSWYWFLLSLCVVPSIIGGLASIYLIYMGIKNYKRDGIVSVSGRIDRLGQEFEDDSDAVFVNTELQRDRKCDYFSREERRNREVVWDYAPKSLFKQPRSLERD